MKQSKAAIVLLVFLIVLTLLAVGCGGNESSTNTKPWTFMLYLDGDEQAMQQDYITAFREMITAKVGSNDDVNVLIQFDRFPTDEAYGAWTTTHRFFYTPGMEPTPENAISDWGDGLGGGREVDMSDPDTLTSFIVWAANNYPADHYALLVADHGYGWRGLMIDVTSDGDFMTVKELGSGLDNSGVHLDLLALDACVMQMNEVLYELRNTSVDIVVGSENLGPTWPFGNIIRSLTDSPGLSSEAFGTIINNLCYEYHPVDPDITLSTIRLGKIEGVTTAVEALAGEMLASSSFTTIQTKAAEVMDKIDEAVVYFRNGSNWDNAYGLSIYFPPPETGYMPEEFFYNYTKDVVSFAEDALWRNFLFVYYNGYIFQDVIPPEIYHVRSDMTEFDKTNIDLYDFCRRIVNYSGSTDTEKTSF
jgi:hypothetical protein